MINTTTDSNDTDKKDIYEYVEQLIDKSLEFEQNRESSIIGQASSIIGALSIYTASLGVLMAALLDHVQKLSKAYIFFSAGLIAIVIISSFVLALVAQWRYRYLAYPSPKEIYESAKKKYGEKLYNDSKKLYAKVDLMDRVYQSILNINNRRAKCVKSSMILIIISIGIFVLFSIIGVILCVI